MTAIKFDVDVNTWATSEADPDDRWSRESTDGTVDIRGAAIAEKNGYDCLEVDADLSNGDTIWLVWARYETGDSFGTDGGQYELLEVCLDEASARASATRYKGITDYSVPWNGYFETLNDIHIDALVLGEK